MCLMSASHPVLVGWSSVTESQMQQDLGTPAPDKHRECGATETGFCMCEEHSQPFLYLAWITLSSTGITGLCTLISLSSEQTPLLGIPVTGAAPITGSGENDCVVGQCILRISYFKLQQ